MKGNAKVVFDSSNGTLDITYVIIGSDRIENSGKEILFQAPKLTITFHFCNVKAAGIVKFSNVLYLVTKDSFGTSS